MLNLSVIILTYNEELNIAQAINSVKDWAKEIIVLDSYSKDKTCSPLYSNVQPKELVRI